ncbi:MAG: excinuclease ABC subunit UvrC [Pseudomonadota bacterium]|nr:excinuclease ABC subunit UvrC [Pseudomonadota bacterium]
MTSDESPDPDSGTGPDVIRRHLDTLPETPGIYRMLGAAGEVLYVGKAISLKKRVASYLRTDHLPHRLQRMVASTASMDFVTTHTEAEALLLEANLIKEHRPRYNVLLRDDKSFPWIVVTDHDFPRLTVWRGKRRAKGRYFGPFATAGAVSDTLTDLHRAFLLRNCSDTFFSTRTRPCLQYHIKRCTAPCVGRVTRQEYAAQTDAAVAFLSGRSSTIQEQLASDMEKASEALEFEKAARLRDRIRALTALQARQDINVQSLEDADVMALGQQGGQTAVQVFFFRNGFNNGGATWFPLHDSHMEIPEILEAFLGQFYTDRPPPPEIILSHALPDRALLEEAFSLRAGSRVSLTTPQRGDRKRVVNHALANARSALERKIADSSSQARLLSEVARLFSLDSPPKRIEVYDNSHISGASPVGTMIVAGPEGFVKSAYRKFNIRDAASAGNDYGMMREVLMRRFGKAAENGGAVENPPDLVLVDGGVGQLNVARNVLAELGLEAIPLAAIAKGPDRNAGREKIFLPERSEPITLDPKDPVLHFLQRLRDEAHRFAIGTHRARRTRVMGQNPLDDIPGIGPARRRSLLKYFGSAQAVRRAGLSDLEKAPGISKTMARAIYDWFHPEEP